MTDSVLIRVQQIRRRSAKATLFSGVAINDDGYLASSGALHYGVTLLSSLAVADVEKGQWWFLTGKSVRTTFITEGYPVTEYRLVPSRAELRRPSGEHIVQLLSTSPAFPGVGEVKARRLWERLGETLYECLDRMDAKPLSEVVGTELAEVLLNGWQQYGNADALRWFQRVGLDLRLSRRVLEVYGADALDTIQADPYRLLAFGMSWAAADSLAQKHFGILPQDERRLAASPEGVPGAARTVTVQPQGIPELLARQLSDRERDPVFRESMSIAQVMAQSLLM